MAARGGRGGGAVERGEGRGGEESESAAGEPEVGGDEGEDGGEGGAGRAGADGLLHAERDAMRGALSGVSCDIWYIHMLDNPFARYFWTG